MKTVGVVKSEKGFYVGDVCYVLSEQTYQDFWGGVKDFKDGVHAVPETGFSFAVAGTAYGDGVYADNKGHEYGVDAGVLGVVPYELVDFKGDGHGGFGGHIFMGAGEAAFVAEDGKFLVELPSGDALYIDTNYEEDEEEECS